MLKISRLDVLIIYFNYFLRLSIVIWLGVRHCSFLIPVDYFCIFNVGLIIFWSFLTPPVTFLITEASIMIKPYLLLDFWSENKNLFAELYRMYTKYHCAFRNDILQNWHNFKFKEEQGVIYNFKPILSKRFERLFLKKVNAIPKW